MRHSRLGCLAVACLLAGLSANAHAHSIDQTPSIASFDHAQGLRQALEARPVAQRSQADYERVLNSYRAVYHRDPGSARADDSIVAVAELLAEQGRVFHSTKALRDAIGQYEFLRRQYPYSQYRFAALLTEGEIDQADLADRDHAKAVFEEFLKTYPGNDLAGQARADLAKILKEEASNEVRARQMQPGVSTKAMQQTTAVSPQSGASTLASVPVKMPLMKKPGKLETRGGQRTASSAAVQDIAAPNLATPDTATRDIATADDATAAESISARNALSPDAATLSTAETANDASTDDTVAHEGIAHLTAIHYWSSPSNTRIAINLEDQVKYVSARIPRPNRIYFDLRSTRLAPGLKEKSIAVGDDASLTRIRAAQFSHDITRIVLDVGAGVDYNAFYLPNPWRLIIDIRNPKESAAPLLAASKEEPLGGNAAQTPAKREMASATSGPSSTHNERSRFHNELDGAVAAPLGSGAASAGQDPFSAVPSLADADSAAIPPDGEELPGAREAERTAAGERSLARTLGLKVGRIVIDAGHGGHDSGSIGPGGLEEKNVTLDVALRLGRLLKNRLGADVIYTRRSDTFIPLQTRTAIANAAHADLFISIHANSSSDDAVRGVESYYLNFTTAPDALEVAARENADSDESIANLSDLVKEITLKDKIEESREFAADVQRALYNGLAQGNSGFKNRGVKKAPFVVLIGANMPSILAEISFLTNPKDARELRQSAYRERIAESLYRGVAGYIDGLNGVRLAENGLRPH